jgi:hypothetical protein
MTQSNWGIMDIGGRNDPYPELEHLSGPDVYFCSNYHGSIKNYNNQSIVIYSCFGEVCNLPELENVLNKFKKSFTIIITHRNYPTWLEQKFNCKIVKVKYAYAYYSRTMAQQSLPKTQTAAPIKKFLSLNSRAQWNRQALMQFLVKFDLMKDFYFSYWCEDRFRIGKKEVYDQTNNIIGTFPTWYNENLDLEKLYKLIPITIEQDRFEGNDWSAGTDFFYQSSFASFVNETYIDENFDPFLTEKAMKPLAYGHPFLLFSSAGVLANLKDLGFETFGDIFDESYDLIQSPQLRFEHLLREVIRICELDNSVLADITAHITPRLQHNYNHFWNTLPDLYDAEMKMVRDQVEDILSTTACKR